MSVREFLGWVGKPTLNAGGTVPWLKKERELSTNIHLCILTAAAM